MLNSFFLRVFLVFAFATIHSSAFAQLFMPREKVPLGDLIWEGKTYNRSTGEITDGGDIMLIGANLRAVGGEGSKTVVSWEKAPWDLKKKMQAARDKLIERIKSCPRFNLPQEMLGAIWGNPREKQSAIPNVSTMVFDTPEYSISANFKSARSRFLEAQMFEVERKGGWTKEKMEAVLESMAGKKWEYDKATELWSGYQGHRAKLVDGKTLRIMTREWSSLVKEPEKKLDSGL